MNSRIIALLLITTSLTPFFIQEISAKCIESEDCIGGAFFPSLKDQIKNNYLLPNIACPNQDHVLTERPNEKLACVTPSMAEKKGWNIPFVNSVDVKGSFPVVKGDSIVFLVPFEITGVTIDEMLFEKQNFVVVLDNNEKSGLISLQIPGGMLDANIEYCNTQTEKFADMPFIVNANNVEKGFELNKNSRNQPALNIPISENTQRIEIIRTCS